MLGFSRSRKNPVPCSVSDADPTPLAHHSQKDLDVFMRDLIVDHDHDRPAARPQIEPEGGLLELVEWIKI